MPEQPAAQARTQVLALPPEHTKNIIEINSADKEPVSDLQLYRSLILLCH